MYIYINLTERENTVYFSLNLIDVHEATHCSLLSFMLWVHRVIIEGDSDERFNNEQFLSSGFWQLNNHKTEFREILVIKLNWNCKTGWGVSNSNMVNWPLKL